MYTFKYYSLLIPVLLCTIPLLSFGQSSFSTSAFKLVLDEKGSIVELTDTKNQVNYAPTDPSALLRVKTDGEIVDPLGFELSGSKLLYSFPLNIQLELQLTSKKEYLRLEEMEWMLARAAGWNAGYALVVNPISLSKNPHTSEVIEAIRTWEEAKQREVFTEAQKTMLKAGEYDFSLQKIDDKEFQLQHYRKEKFSHENLVLQPGQPHYSEWEFQSSSGDQDLYFRLLASGEEGELEEIVLELDGSQTLTIPISLKAGYSCISDGKGNLLLYDSRGSLKKKVEVDWEQLLLDKGSHSLRVSCRFNGDSDLELQGVVKLKDKIELINSP